MTPSPQDRERRERYLERCLASIAPADAALETAERMERFVTGFTLPVLNAPRPVIEHAPATPLLEAPKPRVARARRAAAPETPEPAAGDAEEPSPSTRRSRRAAGATSAAGLRRWTEADDAKIRELRGQGVAIATIAVTLGRTPGATQQRISALGLGSRRGPEPASETAPPTPPPAATPPPKVAPEAAKANGAAAVRKCTRCKKPFRSENAGHLICRWCEAGQAIHGGGG